MRAPGLAPPGLAMREQPTEQQGAFKPPRRYHSRSPRDGRHRPGTPALPHTQVAPSVRWNGGERPSPLLLAQDLQRFLNQPTVKVLFNKCEKCGVKDTLGFQLGDRVLMQAEGGDAPHARREREHAESRPGR